MTDVSPKQRSGEAIDVWSAEFESLCAQHALVLRDCTAEEVEKSEAVAAHFVLRVFRQSRWLRWRFPGALAEGAGGGLERWFSTRGVRKFKLSPLAQKKIRGVFRRPPGARIYDVFLQDRALQKLYPLALVPAGQREFLGWLSTHGRVDQKLDDHEILWFLHASAEHAGDGIALCYLVNPEWQAMFPPPVTGDGWESFLHWLQQRHPALTTGKDTRAVPPRLRAAGRVVADRSDGSGVNILSHFCYPSGIQQAALWAKAAIESAGLPASCRDVPSAIASKRLRRAEWLGLELYQFTIINVAPGRYFATAYDQAGLWRREGVYRIAYWAWELENTPADWRELEPLLDEIWAPTEFVAQAMRSGLRAPVYQMPPGVEIGAVEPVPKESLGIPAEHFVFLFMFDMYSDLARKNPLAVIRVFRKAFNRSDAATLVIKTSRGTPDPVALARLQSAAATDSVILISEDFSREKAYGLIQMCDCFVSLHRAEGFGLGMAEAMLLAKPVIATGYSGNMAFMNRENSLLVDYEMVEVTGAGPLYTGGKRWAQPSEDEAAAYMRYVFQHRAEATALGARAQSDARETLSVRRAGERMARRLRDIHEPHAGLDVTV